MSDATDKLKLSPAELECLQAAANVFEDASPKLGLLGYSGRPTDNRIFIKHLIVDVLHDKYDACVEASAQALPKSANAKALQK